MNGLRTKLQLHDAAEMERKAALARWADHSLYEQFRREQDAEPTWAQVAAMWAVVVVLFLVTGVWM